MACCNTTPYGLGGNHAKICEEYFFNQETCRAISSTFRDRKSIAYGYWPVVRTDYEYMNLCRESVSDNDLFHIPVWFDLTPLIKYIIENWNIDINQDRKTLTALMMAVCRGSTATVQLLLEKGAKTDLVCMLKQETALAMAVDRNHEEKVRLLLEYHADIEVKNENGYTPLIIATLHGNETIVRMLLDRGADIEAKDFKGRTPLHWAADKDHAAIVRLLLEKGANVLSRDKEGFTPARLMGKALGERIVADENHPLGILLKQMYSASPTS
jgi:ankyrin repeat protein